MDYGLLLTIGLVILGFGVLLHLGYSWEAAISRYRELQDATKNEADLQGVFDLRDFLWMNKLLVGLSVLLTCSLFMIVWGRAGKVAEPGNVHLEGPQDTTEVDQKEKEKSLELESQRKVERIEKKEEDKKEKKEDEENIQESISDFRKGIENR